MNRARRKTHKRGMAKRLVAESRFLSFTRRMSSRVVRFFEAGLASPLLNTVKTVDAFASEKVTGPLFTKAELRKNFTMPVRNAVSELFTRSTVLNKLDAFREAALNISLRSVGIFFLTFGVYTAAIFLLKRYISLTLGAANTDDLIFAAITFVSGLLLTMFGGGSILGSLGGGRITGKLLSDFLGINQSSLARGSAPASRTSVAISFLLGSLTGVLTLFYPPSTILAVIAVVLLLITVLHVPEFGLLTSVVTLSFVPVNWTATVLAVSFFAFLLKCLRLKRNFRFGTVDAVVLIMFVIMLVNGIVSNGLTNGEFYLLSFVSVYFLAKNLICSERLLTQAFNALCLGVRIGMALYILGEFAMYIPHDNLRMAAKWATANILDARMLVVMAIISLPFVFSSFSARGTKRNERFTLLLVIACTVVIDSFLFYALTMVTLFVYIAFAFKAPVGAVTGAALVLTPAFSILYDIIAFPSVAAGVQTAYDAVLGIADLTANTLWGAFTTVSGGICTLLFAVTVLLALQRTLGCMAVTQTLKSSQLCGTVTASVVMMLACSVMFNVFSDVRVLGAVWLVLGLCGSVYSVCIKTRLEY